MSNACAPTHKRQYELRSRGSEHDREVQRRDHHRHMNRPAAYPEYARDKSYAQTQDHALPEAVTVPISTFRRHDLTNDYSPSRQRLPDTAGRAANGNGGQRQQQQREYNRED